MAKKKNVVTKVMDFIGKVPNEKGLFFARFGKYGGATYTFTHRDPKTGDLYGEDIPVNENGRIAYGKWVPAEKVQLIWG